MQWSLEIEKSILLDQFITNFDHLILCQIHTQVIPKLCVHTTVQTLSLSPSSLLNPKPLGVFISLNIQPKSPSLTRILILISKPNLHLYQSTHLGSLTGPAEDLSTIFLLKITFYQFFSIFIIFLHFHSFYCKYLFLG